MNIYVQGPKYKRRRKVGDVRAEQFHISPGQGPGHLAEPVYVAHRHPGHSVLVFT